MSKVWIPQISDEVLAFRAGFIKPLIKKGDEYFHIRDIEDYRNTSYMWDPTLGRKANSLTKILRITTYHSFGYYGFFKPSIAEVMAQAPMDKLVGTIWGDVNAFAIVRQPEDADDLNNEALNAGYHVAKTAFFHEEI